MFRFVWLSIIWMAALSSSVLGQANVLFERAELDGLRLPTPTGIELAIMSFAQRDNVARDLRLTAEQRRLLAKLVEDSRDDQFKIDGHIMLGTDTSRVDKANLIAKQLTEFGAEQLPFLDELLTVDQQKAVRERYFYSLLFNNPLASFFEDPNLLAYLEIRDPQQRMELQKEAGALDVEYRQARQATRLEVTLPLIEEFDPIQQKKLRDIIEGKVLKKHSDGKVIGLPSHPGAEMSILRQCLHHNNELTQRQRELIKQMSQESDTLVAQESRRILYDKSISREEQDRRLAEVLKQRGAAIARFVDEVLSPEQVQKACSDYCRVLLFLGGSEEFFQEPCIQEFIGITEQLEVRRLLQECRMADSSFRAAMAKLKIKQLRQVTRSLQPAQQAKLSMFNAVEFQ